MNNAAATQSTAAEAPFSLAPGPGLKQVKLVLFEAMKRSGALDSCLDSRWRNRRLLILGYHGVAASDEAMWDPLLYMPVGALRKRFAVLRDGGFNVLPLREAVERLAAGSLPPRSVVLTFDDGAHDFFSAGVPLLKEFGFPATVYVTTYYAAKEAPVFQVACRYMAWMGQGTRIDGTGLTDGGGLLDLGTLDQRDAVVSGIMKSVAGRGGGVALEAETLALLASRVGVDIGRFLRERRLRIMTADEIAQLPRDLIDVQLHTHRHKVPLNQGAFAREIEDNRRLLAEWRPGAPFDAFCYPSGVTNPQFLPWLRELGVRSGVTCEPGLASSSTEPLLLPRLVDSWRLTRLEFETWLSGAAALVPKVPRRARYLPEPVYD